METETKQTKKLYLDADTYKQVEARAKELGKTPDEYASVLLTKEMERVSKDAGEETVTVITRNEEITFTLPKRLMDAIRGEHYLDYSGPAEFYQEAVKCLFSAFTASHDWMTIKKKYHLRENDQFYNTPKSWD